MTCDLLPANDKRLPCLFRNETRESFRKYNSSNLEK